MVASFLHGVENIAVVDVVSTPAAISDVDSCTRDIVDGTMTDSD